MRFRGVEWLEERRLLTGDFNGDGMYNCGDIDALVGEIAAGTNQALFDLTNDGQVNRDDRDAWLVEAGQVNLGLGRAYRLGDANLDGVVDGSDFNRWNGSKFLPVAEWCNGDFSADGVIDGSDFNHWNGNKFTSSINEPPGLFAITEPVGVTSNPRPEIRWTPSQWVDQYEIIVAAQPDCSGVVQQFAGVVGTSVTPDPLGDGEYFVCATAENDVGTTQATNQGLAFTVDTSTEFLSLNALKDTTLIESTMGGLANGGDPGIFAGRTAQGIGSIRRALVAFDVAAVIPSGSIITSVTLTLYMSKSRGGLSSVELHRSLQDWGEGIASGSGAGAPAMTGDATWIHRFYDTQDWSFAGGDFSLVASAVTPVDQPAYYTWDTTASLVADVQSWLVDPASNFGWFLLGDETVGASAKRFESRESPFSAQRPLLTVGFIPGRAPIVAVPSGGRSDVSNVRFASHPAAVGQRWLTSERVIATQRTNNDPGIGPGLATSIVKTGSDCGMPNHPTSIRPLRPRAASDERRASADREFSSSPKSVAVLDLDSAACDWIDAS